MTNYRVLVTGSRDWIDFYTVCTALDAELALAQSEGRPMVVVHGACQGGTDRYAKIWAGVMGVPVEEHPAQWATHGRSAGPIRNQQMVNRGADICLAFIKNNSKGASGTARLAEQAGIPVNRHWA